VNDQRFFDLAMKVIARQATDAERADLDALLAQEPEFRAEFERLETDARVAKDALPFITACTTSTGEFPAYARERLQTAVRQTLGRPESPAKTAIGWGWRWVLGLAMATAVILLLALPLFRTPNTPVIQLAILDTVGHTRADWGRIVGYLGAYTASSGGGTGGAYRNPHEVEKREAALAALQEVWKGIPVQNFYSDSELQAWEKNWPNDGGRPAARIVYDGALGEIRVSARSQGRVFQKTFPVERDLATTLQQAKAFIQEQTKRR
jgi:hypothetical protein